MMAMTRAHEELEAVNAAAPRLAQFRCTLVIAWPDGHDEVFEGVMPGQLIWPIRGAHGFGYDPMFQPEGLEITCAEMDPAEKNKISHRGKALAQFVQGCFSG
jgi:XTP/dITP diphosphohydrolase